MPVALIDAQTGQVLLGTGAGRTIQIQRVQFSPLQWADAAAPLWSDGTGFTA